MTSNWMGQNLYIFRLYLALSLLCYHKIPKNPFPLIKTASELCKSLSFRASSPSECVTSNLFLLISPCLIFPRSGKSIGCAQEGREHSG